MTWLDEMRADLAEARQEMLAMEMRLRGHATSELHAMEARLAAQLGGQISALAKEIHVVDNKIEKRFSDLLLWSFVFWVGAVGAIAMLAGALRS